MNLTYGVIKFVLHNYRTLQAGEWPNPRNTESGGHAAITARASFENPCLLAGEVWARVALCGIDGLMVADRYGLHIGIQFPMSLRRIAEARHKPVNDVRRALKKVPAYCEGEWRGIKEQEDGTVAYEEYEHWRERTRIAEEKLYQART